MSFAACRESGISAGGRRRQTPRTERSSMTQYTVTGMSCASCQAHVEKAVSKVPGVKAVSVSLLTNSMGVEGTADSAAVIAAVEKAGYGASLREESAKSSERVQAADSGLRRKP